MNIVQTDDGHWQLKAGDRVLGIWATNAEAWRAFDREEREPISPAESKTDWICNKILGAE
jgi:hypothetical protein